MRRVTMIVPGQMADDARALAAILDDDPSGLGGLSSVWENAERETCLLSSGLKSADWFMRLGRPLKDRPAWDEDRRVNMTGAVRAATAITFWPNEDDPDSSPPLLDRQVILCLVGLSAHDAIIIMKQLGFSQASLLQ